MQDVTDPVRIHSFSSPYEINYTKCAVLVKYVVHFRRYVFFFIVVHLEFNDPGYLEWGGGTIIDIKPFKGLRLRSVYRVS